MADDITLTVRVRDLTRGDFNRLDNQLDRMRRSLQGVNRSTQSAGSHSQRLGNDLNTLSNRFRQLQQSGSMSRRELNALRNTLTGMSRSALNAAHSGEITQRNYRLLDGEIRSLQHQLNYLGRGLDDNTNRLRRHNNTVNTTVRTVNGMVRSINTTNRTIAGNTRYINTTTRTFGQLGDGLNQVAGDGKFLGGVFSHMRQKLIGLAVVLTATLLPTIGALAPMLVGLGAVGGAAALVFKDMAKEAKKLKPAFDEWKKIASAAVMPKFKRSLDDIEKAMTNLNPVIKIGGDAFGTLIEKMSKGLSSAKFQKLLVENSRMGSKWVLEFAASLGKFTTAFLEFGTKSKPALDAWQELLGGFLDTGLPGMFKELEQGTGGSSKFLSGLASLINESLLPGLGRLFGSFMMTFGPMLGNLLKIAGKLIDAITIAFEGLMTVSKPLMDGLSNGFKGIGSALSPLKGAVEDFGIANYKALSIGLSVAKDLVSVVGGALLEAFTSTFGSDMGMSGFKNGLTDFSGWVEDNQAVIRQAFLDIASVIIDMVTVGVQMLPLLTDAFVAMANTVIQITGTMIHAMAATFGDLPIIGDKFKDAAKGFDESVGTWGEKLSALQGDVHEFSDKATAGLSRAKVVLDVKQAEESLAYVKQQLQDPELTKERRAELTADQSRAEEALRVAKDQLRQFDGQRTSADVEANTTPFFGSMAAARRAQIRPKSVKVNANTSGFLNAIQNITNKVLGTSYINVQMRRVEENNAPAFSANGNLFRSFANGGTERHEAQMAPAGSWRVWGEPETGGESYIPLGPSKRPRSKRIAEQTVGILGGRIEWFAKGGVTKAEKEARKEARGDLTLSYFGKMAGFKKDEFIHALGLPESLSALVDNLNKWRSVIKKATHGATEQRLLGTLSVGGKALIKYEKQLTAVNKSLEKAKDKLSELKQAATQLKDSVKQGIISELNLTRSANADDSQVTLNTIMSQMTADSARAGQFESSMAQLKKMGFSGRILEQIAAAGVEGGGLETATALLGASPEQIKQMNTMNQSIRQSADDTGDIAAEALYGAGIKAAEGFVKGLEKQKKHLERQMTQLAEYLEKAIKKALGIKSPSKVMEKLGSYTAEGFGIGIEKNARPRNAISNMMAVVPSRPVSAPVKTASGAPMIIHLSLGGKDLGEVIIDPLRKAVSHRGGNVQVVLGS